VAAAAALVLAGLLLPACGAASSQPAHAQGGHEQSPGAGVTVRSGGKTAGRFDMAALRRLPAADVATPRSPGKKVQHGPRVRALLARAGVQRFGRLRVVGTGGQQTFSSAEIDDQVVLDFDNAGTVKLAGAHVPLDRWVHHVTELDAGP
jgi:hypothetical protein